jgi:short-subunit dehydrogenase
MAFAGQVAVITGASSGIGWALAKALAAEGYKVGLVARRHDQLQALADEIGRQGGTAACAAADVGQRDQVLAAVKAVTGQLGPADLLVANAGTGTPTAVDPLNVADTERLTRVNFLGVVYAIEAVLPEMLRRGRGHLAAVSSLAAYKGLPGESAYCASKAAVNVYMEGLRIQLHDRGIAVTTLCPGFVRTPMTAHHRFWMPGLMDADEAARRMVRALRRRKKVYNFPWQMALLMKLTVWLPDRVLGRFLRRHTGSPGSPAAPPTQEGMIP